jgi:hypothetical protein
MSDLTNQNPVPTKIGDMTVTVNHGQSVCVRFMPAVVRGVSYNATLQLKPVDGVWTVDRTNGNCYIRRPDKKHNHDAPSDSAREAIIDIAHWHARHWIAVNPVAMLTVERDRLVREKDSAEAKAEALRQELDAANRAAAAASNVLAEFDERTANRYATLPNA